MAHELHFEDGKAAMMYVGETPWHCLGTKLNAPPTSAKAIKAAGLDWTVQKVPLFAIEGRGVAPVPNRFAIVPEHRWGKPDCPIFGIVGKSYTPLQNADAFAFFDSIVGEGAAVYHTAGALGAGERVWVLAKLPGTIHVTDDDVSEKYLLLANGHDGNTSVRIKFTPVRVVCQNTLSLALESGPSVAVHHGWNLGARMQNAKTALGLINAGFDRLQVEFKQMASLKLTEQQLDAYLSAVFPEPPKDASPRVALAVAMDRDVSKALSQRGPGNAAKGVSESLWSALNGVTDYVDHRRGDLTAVERLQSVWFGRGHQIKARAYREALKLVPAKAESVA